MFLASETKPNLESVINKHTLNEFLPKPRVYKEVLLSSPTEPPLPSLLLGQHPPHAKG